MLRFTEEDELLSQQQWPVSCTGEVMLISLLIDGILFARRYISCILTALATLQVNFYD